MCVCMCVCVRVCVFVCVCVCVCALCVKKEVLMTSDDEEAPWNMSRGTHSRLHAFC